MFDGIYGFNFDFVGFANYPRIFSDGVLRHVFSNTMYYFFIVTPLQIVLGVFLAMLIWFFAGKLSTTARVLLYIPAIMPSMAVGQLFRKVFETQPYLGLVNEVFALLGFDNLVRPWLGLPDSALSIVSIVDIWRWTGFYLVIIYSALTNISDSLLEAAKIDGAGRLAQVRYIMLPLIKPVIVICTVIAAAGNLQVFETPFILTGGGPGNYSNVLPLLMYNTAFAWMDYGYASAMAMVILLQCVVVTFLINLLNRRKVDY